MKILNHLFIPFIIDNLGGINSSFYCADEEGHGDIIIDCGLSNCFKIWIQKELINILKNVIGWMGKSEINFYKTTQWRPNSINYKINKNDKWNEFKEIIDPKIMKTLFAIDNSGSIYENRFKIGKNFEFLLERRRWNLWLGLIL